MYSPRLALLISRRGAIILYVLSDDFIAMAQVGIRAEVEGTVLHRRHWYWHNISHGSLLVI
jgi:hypothetical protein